MSDDQTWQGQGRCACGASNGDEHDLDCHEANREAAREVERDGMREYIDNLAAERDELQVEVDRLRAERRRALDACAEYVRQNIKLTAERDRLKGEADQWYEDKRRAWQVAEDAKAERDRLDGMLTRCDEARERVIAERDRWRERADRYERGIRDVHRPVDHTSVVCRNCLYRLPCPTLALLDGDSEPEVGP